MARSARKTSGRGERTVEEHLFSELSHRGERGRRRTHKTNRMGIHFRRCLRRAERDRRDLEDCGREESDAEDLP
jgi:hypothetical protein